MNEHPVPRNVTGFQFQLIGFMTLKQFGYLLAGALLAFAFYNAGGLSFFRFPIAAFFLFTGIAFAFIPIQERPLDTWIVNLIKSIYSPTQFVWQKEIEIPDLFTMKARPQQSVKTAPVQHEADTKAKLNAYLASISPREEQRLDLQENQTLKKVSDLFGQTIPVRPVQLPHQPAASAPAPLTTLASRLFSHTAPTHTTPKPRPVVRHTTPALSRGAVAGLVRTQNEALSGMLIHITNSQGQQVRLFKTNKEGKFATTIPLDPGNYHLSVEDPQARYSFKPILFEIGEEGLHPWLIMPTGELS